MSAKPPITGVLSVPFFLIQMLIIAVLVYVFNWLGVFVPFFFAAVTYALLTLVLRRAFSSNHRRGVRLMVSKKYTEAIGSFGKSIAYLNKNSWVDKYRFLTLLSSSKRSYREMALCNIAFCHTQIGNGQQAKQMYEAILQEFPDNDLALAALNMLRSMEQ